MFRCCLSNGLFNQRFLVTAIPQVVTGSARSRRHSIHLKTNDSTFGEENDSPPTGCCIRKGYYKQHEPQPVLPVIDFIDRKYLHWTDGFLEDEWQHLKMSYKPATGLLVACHSRRELYRSVPSCFGSNCCLHSPEIMAISCPA